MRTVDYCVFREDELYVAQCLNVDVSSFGHSREEAVAQLREAVELYFEGEAKPEWDNVSEVSVGQERIHA